jgi:hypothetical protein
LKRQYVVIALGAAVVGLGLLALKKPKVKYGHGPMMHPRPMPTPIMPDPYPMMRRSPAHTNTIYNASKGTTGVKGTQNTDPWDLGPNLVKERRSIEYQFGGFCCR